MRENGLLECKTSEPMEVRVYLGADVFSIESVEAALADAKKHEEERKANTPPFRPGTHVRNIHDGSKYVVADSAVTRAICAAYGRDATRSQSLISLKYGGSFTFLYNELRQNHRAI